ncbi:MAG: hypothetical protein COB15_04145 [Flavobacteriales bacterium]|nr:MAG: hypothetical protein COB15_04145 [Flavobacteriales bacterium]
MENILLILTSSSFLIFWVTTVIFYTPACFNLKAMIDSINKDGALTKTKAPFSWYFTNFKTLECWTIKLPKSEKHLKYNKLAKTTVRIRIYRKIRASLAPVIIICGFILLMTVE